MPDTWRPGDIVIAKMIDPQGGNEKCRTALIVEKYEDGFYIFIAITSSFNPCVLMPKNQVELSWKQGKPSCHTGLTKPSRADVDWYVRQGPIDVEKIGYVKAIPFTAIKRLFIERLGEREIAT